MKIYIVIINHHIAKDGGSDLILVGITESFLWSPCGRCECICMGVFLLFLVVVLGVEARALYMPECSNIRLYVHM